MLGCVAAGLGLKAAVGEHCGSTWDIACGQAAAALPDDVRAASVAQTISCDFVPQCFGHPDCSDIVQSSTKCSGDFNL
jgi:hypothetical protein